MCPWINIFFNGTDIINLKCRKKKIFVSSHENIIQPFEATCNIILHTTMFTMSSRRIIYQVCLCLLGVIVSVCQQGNVLSPTNRIIAYTGWHFRWYHDLYSYLSLTMFTHLIFFEAKKMFIAKDDLNIVFKWGSTTK